jgi:hypothetical protein
MGEKVFEDDQRDRMMFSQPHGETIRLLVFLDDALSGRHVAGAGVEALS